MITRASIKGAVAFVMAVLLLGGGGAGATPQTVEIGSTDELDILRNAGDFPGRVSADAPIDLSLFSSFIYSDNFTPNRGTGRRALSLPSRDSVKAGDQASPAASAEAQSSLVDLLQPLNQSLIVFDSESAGANSGVDPGIVETEVIDGRQAQLMLDVRHALLDVYDSLADVRGALSEARNTLDQMVPVYVGSTDAKIGFDASYGGPANGPGGGPARRSGGGQQSTNGFIRFIANVLTFIREDYWIVLIVFFAGIGAIQFARRS